MIYGGPGFLAVLWFGSSPTPSPLSSQYHRRQTAELRKIDNLLTGEGGAGVGKEPIMQWQESLVLNKSAILSDRDNLYTPKSSCVSRGWNFKELLHNKLRLPKVLSMAHIVKILNRLAWPELFSVTFMCISSYGQGMRGSFLLSNSIQHKNGTAYDGRRGLRAASGDRTSDKIHRKWMAKVEMGGYTFKLVEMGGYASGDGWLSWWEMGGQVGVEMQLSEFESRRLSKIQNGLANKL